MKTSVVITSTAPNGSKLQKTLTDVNASCSNAVLTSFSQQLNGLTNNTYEKTDRVDKQNCDTEAGTVEKLTPTINVYTPTDELGAFYANYNAPVDVNAGVYYGSTVTIDGSLAFIAPYSYHVYYSEDLGTYYVHDQDHHAVAGVNVTIMSAENDTYKAGFATVNSGSAS